MKNRFKELYKDMLQNFVGGLSNTSTKKFDDIVQHIADYLNIDKNDIYATGSGSRPGNLEVRLSQGVRATTHTVVGLGFIVDSKNTDENVTKLTNSAIVTCEKFLGRGKAHYDNIVIFVESNGEINASGILYSEKTDITDKLIEGFGISNIKQICSTPSIESTDDSTSYTNEELRDLYKSLIETEGTAGNAIFIATYGKNIVGKIQASSFINFVQEKYPNVGRQQELNQAYRMYEYFISHPQKMHLPGIPSTTNNSFQLSIDMPLQQIFYGAPGTGKSYKVNEVSKNYSTIRTTFHPDSDYSTFVGAYKPTMTKVRKSVVIGQDEKEVKGLDGNEYENKIQYSFVKQAFLKAYLGAWKKYTEPQTNEEGKEEVAPQFLVIEEINRGNCAQIFGDLFQLLDRQEKNGFSCYPIEADADLQQEIENAFLNEAAYKLTNAISVEGVVEGYTSNYQHEDGTPCTLSEDIQSGRILLLPNNLYIWATMNTSDQSLFPIDSAFKRRWEWEYIRISEGRDKDTHEPLRYCFNVNGTDYDWWSFIEKINERVGSITSSEDKKLGYFFCGTEKNISATKFVGKVCFYLWNDVFKDFGFGKKDQSAAFKKADGKDIAFDDFYKENPDTFKTEVNEVLLGEFINKLGIETVAARQVRESQPVQTSTPQQESQATTE